MIKRDIELSIRGKAPAQLAELVGLNLIEVKGLEKGSASVLFITECNRFFLLDHEQDCCEYVAVEEVAGDTKWLIGCPIVSAESSSTVGEKEDNSETYTFYKISTNQGTVDIRFYGTSNGYYSEGVDFSEITKTRASEVKYRPYDRG